MTWLASREIRSYRDLPQTWYQVRTKLRDEARPKSGILRTREFIMKDSYSFDSSEAGLDNNYRLHADAYHRIFERCGLSFLMVESDPGMMGGATSHEFMAPSPAGEDEVAICASCGYAANVELALSAPRKNEPVEWPFEEVPTPEKRTVQEVSNFLKLSPSYFIKSILVISDNGPVLALVRGDQELHEKKLAKIFGNHRPAQKAEVKELRGVEAGFIGPMGQKVRIRTGARVVGPVPLPTKLERFAIRRSAFIDKDSHEHFGIRTHNRLIDVLDPDSKTIDMLMRLNLPAGVDIEIKI